MSKPESKIKHADLHYAVNDIYHKIIDFVYPSDATKGKLNKYILNFIKDKHPLPPESFIIAWLLESQNSKVITKCSEWT